MPIIYLDHCATTQPNQAILNDYCEKMRDYSGNPASQHRLGQKAAKLILDSRQIVASLVGCQPNNIIWTSGGSESINLALKGYVEANAKRGRTIITAAGEHSATRETLEWLKENGYKIITIPIDQQGLLDLQKLEQAIDEDTVLLSFLLVNNVTGAILPIQQIVEMKQRLRPLAAIHLDGVQAFGKIPVHFDQLGVEMISGSGHKFGSPKGIGFLIKKTTVRLKPIIHGGGQQGGLRSGTENAPLVSALAAALLQAIEQLDQKQAYCRTLRDQLLTELRQNKTEYAMISPPDGASQILNIAFDGLRGETLQHALEMSDIMISTGSACSSNHTSSSDVLIAMGITKTRADCSVRVSLASDNTPEEIHQTAQAISQSCVKYQRSSKQ